MLKQLFVYNNFTFPWSGIFISTLIRIDKSINGGEWTTQYYISNDTGDGDYFLQKILQKWSVETMHFYKDYALYKDKCKVHKEAFALPASRTGWSVLRSFVINILHLNQVKNIAGKVVDATYSLAEALALVSIVKLRYGFIR